MRDSCVEPSTQRLISAFGHFNLTHPRLKSTTFAFSLSYNVVLRVVGNNEVASHFVMTNAESLCQQNDPDHNDFYNVFGGFFFSKWYLCSRLIPDPISKPACVFHTVLCCISRAYYITSDTEVWWGLQVLHLLTALFCGDRDIMTLTPPPPSLLAVGGIDWPSRTTRPSFTQCPVQLSAEI